EERFEIVNQGFLDAADIGDDRAFLDGGGKLAGEGRHLPKGRAEDDQIGAANRRGQIAGGGSDGAGGDRRGNARLAPNVAGDVIRQGAPPQGEPERPAQQANSNQGDLSPAHFGGD